MAKAQNERRTAALREELETLKARYDSGAVPIALFAVIRQLETEIAWREVAR
jgi:hypothetical protein